MTLCTPSSVVPAFDRERRVDGRSWSMNALAPLLHRVARGDRGMEGEDGKDLKDGGHDERWLAIAEDTWRKASAEANAFRRHALFEETAACIVRGTTRSIRAFCLSQSGGDPARADDLAQQTYLTLWRTLPRFEGRSSLKTFVHGIAHNICRDANRAKARAHDRGAHRPHHSDHDELIWHELAAELSPRPDEALVRQEDVNALRLALTRLEPRDTWLLWAKVVDQQSYAEMLPAFRAEFGTQINTAEGLRTAFFHAKRRLLAALEGGPE